MAEHVLESAGHGLERVLSPAARWAFRVAMLVMALMMIPVFVDVILRYVSDGSLEGAYELEEFSLALVSFLALASIQEAKGHINITFVTDHCSERVRLLLETFVWCAGTPLLLTLAWRMAVAAMAKYAVGEVSFDLELPIWPVMVVCAAGMLLFGLFALAHALECLGRCFREGHVSGGIMALVAAAIVLSVPVWFRALDISISAGALGGLAMIVMMVLLFIGMPIGLSMALVGSLGLLLLQPNPEAALAMIGQSSYSKGAEYSYTVIPLFILMGEFAYYSGISRELFYAANMWLGRLPGGLAVAGIAGCTGFAAVCGDSMATAVTMGSVALPEMRKKNYHPGLSCACLAAGGTLGILIPPSMGFIFYAIVTEESIGRLFLAGVLPGMLLAGMFIVYTVIVAVRHPELAPRGDATTFGEKLRSLKGVVVMLGLIFIILGGILMGFFSPNEGAGVGAACTFLYAFLSRKLSWQDTLKALHSTVTISARLMFILVSVGILGYFFAATQLPQLLAEFVGGLDANRYVIFAGIVVLYIILGCMMNVIPMILLTLPALYPTILALQFDPIWFGVCVVLLMEMGQITPPVGVNVFAMSSVARDIPMADIFKSIVPYFSCMCLLLLLLVIFPDIALWLPTHFF